MAETNNPAVQAVRKLFPKLVEAVGTVSSIEAMAGKLLAADMVADNTANDAVLTIGLPVTQRSWKLMLAVKTYIATNPESFKEFVSILREEAPLCTLADQLERKYSEYLHSQLPSPRPTVASGPTSVGMSTLQKYASYLRNVYDRYSKPPSPKTFPICRGALQYIDLAVEEKVTMTRQEVRNDRIKAVVKGNITKILQSKSSVRIEDALKPGGERKLHCVLVEGAPGVGKSTFVWKLYKEWQEYKILQDYQLVVLLDLQDKRVQAANKLTDVFSYSDESTKEQICREITDTGGEGTLIIIDGIDEFPDLLAKSSVFVHLIQGRSLPLATILITTRPSGSWTIFNLLDGNVSRYLEILGFLPENIQRYYRHVFSTETDCDLLDEFERYLSVNPHIMGMMYIPLNCVIVTEVYRYCKLAGNPTPNTMTELYTDLCLALLYRYLGKHSMGLLNLRSYSDLPQPVYEDFIKICEIAFENVQAQKSSYSPVPSSPESFNHLGLMQSFADKASISYLFLHHTIQEYLAAVHISMLPSAKQTELLQVHYKHCHFENVWRFFAGRTQFRSIGWEKVKDICFTCSEIDDEDKEGPTGIIEPSPVLDITNYGLHWLYESRDITNMRILGSSTTRFRSITSITPFDCHALGSCITNSQCAWELILSGNQIEEAEIDMLIDGLEKQSTSHTKPPQGHISKLDLCIGKYAVTLISKLPPEQLLHIIQLRLQRSNLDHMAALELRHSLWIMHNLEILDLSFNPFQVGGATKLVKALVGLRCLKEFHMRYTEIGLADIKAIRSLLKDKGCNLELLDISENDLSPNSLVLISEVLEHHNDSLKILNLSCSHFDLASMNSFASMLERNYSIEVLHLWNCSIDDRGISCLAGALSQNASVREIDLTNNSFSIRGAHALSDCIKENETIELMTLCENSIGKEGTASLLEGLQENTTLIEMKLPEEYQKFGDKLPWNSSRVKWSRHY